MRIEEIDGVKYHVLQTISEDNTKLIDALSERHKENHKDFFLLKKVNTLGIKEFESHYLLCRKIDDVEVEDI